MDPSEETGSVETDEVLDEELDCVELGLDCARSPRAEDEPEPVPAPDRPPVPGTPLPSVTEQAPPEGPGGE